MKTKDSSKEQNKLSETDGSTKGLTRRELLNKAGLVALTAATTMIVMKSQGQPSTSATAIKPADPGTNVGGSWHRTTR